MTDQFQVQNQFSSVASSSLPPHGLQDARLPCRLPFPSPGDLPDSGIEPGSPALPADALPSAPPGKALRRTSKRRADLVPSLLSLGPFYCLLLLKRACQRPGASQIDFLAIFLSEKEMVSSSSSYNHFVTLIENIFSFPDS